MSFYRRTIFAGAAVMIAGAIVAVNRMGTPGHPPRAASSPLLKQNISAVHLHGVRADDAIQQLSVMAGVKIAPKWDAMPKLGDARYQEIWLDFDNLPLEDALYAILEQLSGDGLYDRQVGVEGPTIVVGPITGYQQVVRIYDISDLLREPSYLPPQLDDIKPAISAMVRFDTWPSYWSSLLPSMRAGSGELLILQTPDGHARIREFLDALRAARPDGSGPFIVRHRVVDKKSFNTELRFYDVRDLGDRPRFDVQDRSYFYLPNPMRGTLAVAVLLDPPERDGRSNGFPSVVVPVRGRVMVEQTPQMQSEVRMTLAAVRAGKAFKQFSLTPLPANHAR